MPFLGKTPSQIVDPEVDIDGGTIDGVSIGSVTADAGAFTNLTATGTLTLPDDGISGDDVNGGTISNFASTGIDDNAASTAITIDSSQDVTFTSNVSIGTSNNLGVLTIKAAASDDQDLITITEDATNQSFSINGNFAGLGSTGNAITLDSFWTDDIIVFRGDGNVGLGTASPSNTLTVSKDTGSTPTVYINNSGPQANEGAALKVQASGRGTGIGDTSIFSVHNNASEIFTVRNDGNVGVGITSPSSALHVDSSNDGPIFDSGGTANTNHALLVRDSANNQLLRVNNNGFVGIGTTSPDRYLHVNTSRSGDWLAEIHNTHATNGYGLKVRAGDDANVTAMRVVDVSNNTLMEIQGGGNVGIGTTNPSYKLDVDVGAPNSNDQILGRFSSQAGTRSIAFVWDDSASTLGVGTQTNHPLAFHINGSSAEKMRLDTSGNLLVGKTTTSLNTAGVALLPNGELYVVRDGGPTTYFNRETSDGDIVVLRKDNTTVGAIGAYFGGIYVSATDGTGSGLGFRSTQVVPCTTTGANRDNAIDLGASGSRFDDVYATNGTIQTSDANEKQDIEALSEAEQRVAVAAKGLLRKFHWKSAVEEKGDDARIHFGIIAQDLQAAFEAEGLDAGRYGMFIHSTWWEHEVEVPALVAQDAVYETQTDEEGNEMQVLVSEAVEGAEAYTQTDTYNTAEEAPEGAVERSRMGVRYSELLAFIVAAI